MNRDIVEILNLFGLNFTEVQPNVLKIINTDKEINIDKLQWKLEDCILITSLEKRTEKLDSGIHTMIANVYYIIIGTDNKELAYKYDDIATEEFGRTLYKYYKYSSDSNDWMGTIFREDE